MVSVNSKIIEKLKVKTEYDYSLPPFKKLIIRYNVGDNKLNKILNPFFTFESYGEIDDTFKKMIDIILNVKFKFDTSFSFKERLEDELKKRGVSKPSFEINSSKTKILTILIEKYNEQLDIYNDNNSSYYSKILASKIIIKYQFLIDLFNWMANPINENFAYIDL